MVSGEIRKGETNEFPIDGSVNWYVILTVSKEKIKDKYYTGTQYDKKELLEQLKRLTKANTYFKLYGVWPGQWNTHLFDLDPKIMISKLESFFESKNKKL